MSERRSRHLIDVVMVDKTLHAIPEVLWNAAVQQAQAEHKTIRQVIIEALDRYAGRKHKRIVGTIFNKGGFKRGARAREHAKTIEAERQPAQDHPWRQYDNTIEKKPTE